MSDNKRELNNGVDSSSPELGNPADVGEGLSGAFADSARPESSQIAPSYEGGGSTYILHSEEIVVEHLDELPDVEHVEELIGEGHVYDEETAGALVALMFAKTHRDDDTLPIPEYESQIPEESQKPEAPHENPVTQPSAPAPTPTKGKKQKKNKKKKKYKKKKKGYLLRTLLILVAVSIAAICICFACFSNDTIDHNESPFQISESADSVTITGYLGSDADVVIPSTINGKPVVAIGSTAFSNRSNLTSVTIGNSVTSIGNSAFSHCYGLTSIVIPESVTSIDGYAFSGCSALTSIVIPDSVTSIGGYAFSGCSSLTSIAIPDSVASIASGAFSSCSSLTSIVIPDSVTGIGDRAFYGCDGLTSIVIPDSVTSIGNEAFSGCSLVVSEYEYGQYIGDGNNPYAILVSVTNKNLGTYTIHEDTKVIAYGAFQYYSSLESIVIPVGVRGISSYAFSSCSSLTSIVIPDSVTGIGEGAFYNCSNLASVTIGNSVTSIGDSAFADCSSLTSIVIPESVTTIGNWAFSNCRSLTNITVDKENVAYKSIDGNLYTKDEKTLIRYAVGNNDGSFTIPDGVTSIASGAFSSCTSLTSIVIPDSVASIASGAFSSCYSLTSIVIPDSVTSIGSSAFRDCHKLTSIVIPDSVTSIDNYAFYGCSNLAIYCEAKRKPYGWSSSWKDSNCPVVWDYIISVPAYDFEYTESNGEITITKYIGSDSEVYVPDAINGKPVVAIGYGAFSYCSNLASLVIPDSVTSIGDEAFSNCSSLESIVIPNNLKSIGNHAFYDCLNLTAVHIGNLASWCNTSFENYSANPLYFAKNLYLNGELITNLVIPNDITSIGAWAFAGCTPLKSVVIPDGVASIGEGAFSACSSLESMTIPFVGGSIKTEIDTYQYPFAYIFGPLGFSDSVSIIQYHYGESTSLSMGTEYHIPASLKSVTVTGGNILYGAFSNCSSITSITIPDSATSIGMSAFTGCSSLESIAIPDSVTSIGMNVFASCSSLKSAVIPDSVEYIGYDAFQNCSNLTIYCEADTNPASWASAWNPDNRPVVWGYIIPAPASDFEYTESNGEITITKYIGSSSKVSIPDTINGKPVVAIGYEAFYLCSSLTSVVIPDGIESIGDNAFYDCASLKSIVIGNSVEHIGREAFRECVSLEYFYFNSTIIDDFDCCSRVFLGSGSQGAGIKLVIGKNVSSIPSYLFSGYNDTSVTPTHFTDITFEEESMCVSISGDAFSGCERLVSIVIPESVTSIADRILSGAFRATIYCEAKECPSDWSDDWNIFRYHWGGTYKEGYCPVVWNCKSNSLSDDGYLHVTVDGVRYAIKDGEAIVAPQFSGATELILPSEITYDKTMYPVTRVGAGAFHGCAPLTNIAIPNTITSIDDYAFRNCSSLTSIVIPDCVTSIGNYAFYCCSSLTSIVIPDGVTSIEYAAFSGCSSLTSIVIPDGVTSIGDYAFYNCSKLTNIVIPEGVTSIGNSAFYNCDEITSIVIPDSVTIIGYDAFYNCDSLTIYCEAESKPSGWNSNWNYSNRPVVWGYIQSSPASDFEYTESNGELTITGYVGGGGDVVIPSAIDGNPVVAIGGEAFHDCSSLTSIIIPNSVMSIGEGSFSGCSSLESMTIPFVGGSIKTENDTYQYPFGYIFGESSYSGGTEIPQYYYGESTSSATYTYYCIPASLKSVTVTGGNIVYGAFWSCSSLTKVRIADGVTSIGEQAFRFCYSLTSIEIADSVKSIGYAAFPGCSALSSVVIPSSVTSIGDGAFADCSSLTSIIVDASNEYYCSIDGNLYTKDLKVLMQYPAGKTSTSFVISNGVEEISSFAFYNCTSLTNIQISDSIKSIGNNVFQYTSLTSIVIPDSVTSIGEKAFQYCSNLSSVTIGNSVTSIGDEAFDVCDSLTSIIVDDDNTAYKSIDGNLYTKDEKTLIQYAIGKTDSSFIIPDSVTSIGNKAFYRCSSLTSIVIPDSVTSIGEGAFNSCSNLTIYCEAESEPAGWSAEWNYSNCPVVWGYVIPEE